jgi:hypothetical protein
LRKFDPGDAVLVSRCSRDSSCSDAGRYGKDSVAKMLAKAHSGSQLILLCCREFRGESDYVQKEVFTYKYAIQNQIQKKGETIEVYEIELQERRKDNDHNYNDKGNDSLVKDQNEIMAKVRSGSQLIVLSSNRNQKI